MQSNRIEKSRIEWVDYLKGISIILVIVGHTIGNFYIRSTIFSFHMPLFFFLSGLTSKSIVDKDTFKISVRRSFKRYVIPAYIVWILRNIAYYFINDRKYTFLQYLLSALFASGIELNIKGLVIPAFGMMWFLIVLFETRIICNVIGLLFHRVNAQIIVVIILAFAGIVCQRCLPFSLDVALVSIVFFFAGRVLKGHQKIFDNALYTATAGILWGGGTPDIAQYTKPF